MQSLEQPLAGKVDLTDDFKARTYKDEGLRWIESTTMSSLLLRHYPELAPALKGVKNAFNPWNGPSR